MQLAFHPYALDLNWFSRSFDCMKGLYFAAVLHSRGHVQGLFKLIYHSCITVKGCFVLSVYLPRWVHAECLLWRLWSCGSKTTD